MKVFASWLLYYGVLLPVSYLPYPLLYALSDVFYYVLYYLVRYRRDVVRDNLTKCFPEKTEEEVTALAKAFYRHLCDLFLESVKNFSISLEEARKRMHFVNPEVMDRLAAEGRSVILAGGHYANWELWAISFAPQVRHSLIGIYKPLKDKYLDKKMIVSRGKYGMHLVPTRSTGDYLRSHVEELKAVVLAVDQSPPNPDRCLWVQFLGRPTAAYFGAEKYARDFDFAVVYGRIRKIRRGYYECVADVLFESPRETSHGEITQCLFDVLASEIYREPQYWLWSHRRWKHRPPAPAETGGDQ